MWLSLLENKEALYSIFGLNSPSLENVVIKEMKLYYNGPLIEVRIELHDYPINPPRKWVLQNYNKVDLILQLIEIESINITSWNNTNLCKVFIEKTGNSLIIKAAGNCEFEIIAKWIRIQSISAFQNENLSPLD